jgi:hypothetical protein
MTFMVAVLGRFENAMQMGKCGIQREMLKGMRQPSTVYNVESQLGVLCEMTTTLGLRCNPRTSTAGHGGLHSHANLHSHVDAATNAATIFTSLFHLPRMKSFFTSVQALCYSSQP